jgi:hypothetical protein
MAVSSKLYVRVITQDRNRGFMLLTGYSDKIVQSTATQITTLSGVTRKNLTETIERLAKIYSASEVCDVTAPGILRQLRVLFNEPHPMTQKQQDALTAKTAKALEKAMEEQSV